MITLKDNIKDIDSGIWNELISNSSNSTFFQTQQCYRFYKSLSFMKPFVFSVFEDSIIKGVIVGYIQQEKNPLKQFMTRRAIVPGGALLADDISDEALTKLLLKCRSELKKNAIYIEFRNFNDYSVHKEVFKRCGFAYQEHLNFHNDTSSVEIINDNLGKSRKRDVKKAEKNEYILVDKPNPDQLKEYYEVLKEMYRLKVHTPLFPFEFFQKLLYVEASRLFLISDGSRIIEGVVCVMDNDTMYEWFACGVVSHTYATYKAMEYAANNGIGRYDMMGAGKPSEAYGVRDFKSQFGGKLVEHGRFVCICRPLQYEMGKLGVKILKRK